MDSSIPRYLVLTAVFSSWLCLLIEKVEYANPRIKLSTEVSISTSSWSTTIGYCHSTRVNSHLLISSNSQVDIQTLTTYYSHTYTILVWCSNGLYLHSLLPSLPQGLLKSMAAIGECIEKSVQAMKIITTFGPSALTENPVDSVVKNYYCGWPTSISNKLGPKPK